MHILRRSERIQNAWTEGSCRAHSLRRSPPVHRVDPPSGQISESGKVLGAAQPLRLEAAHLAGRGGRPADRPVPDYPAPSEVIADPRNCSSSRRSKSSLKVPLSASPVGSAIAALAPPSRQIKHRKRLAQLHGGVSARIHYQHSKRLQSQTGWSPLSKMVSYRRHPMRVAQK